MDPILPGDDVAFGDAPRCLRGRLGTMSTNNVRSEDGAQSGDAPSYRPSRFGAMPSKCRQPIDSRLSAGDDVAFGDAPRFIHGRLRTMSTNNVLSEDGAQPGDAPSYRPSSFGAMPSWRTMSTNNVLSEDGAQLGDAPSYRPSIFGELCPVTNPPWGMRPRSTC